MKVTQKIEQIEPLNETGRIIVLAVNILITWIIYSSSTGSFFPGGAGTSIWLIAAIAYWLLALLAAPYFLPPRDSLGNAISVILLLVPFDFLTVTHFHRSIVVLNWITIILALLVSAAALVAIFQKNNQKKFTRICYRISSILGKGEVLFTAVVIIGTLGFYQNQLGWVFTILGLWTFMVVAKPVELAVRIFVYIRGLKMEVSEVVIAGSVIRIDDPDLIRVSLAKGNSTWTPNQVHITHTIDGKSSYILPLFVQIQNEEIIGTGLCCPVEEDTAIPVGNPGGVYVVAEDGLANQLSANLSGEEGSGNIVGIITEGSSIGEIKFQAIRHCSLEEGMVVFSYIRGKKIYYQILDAKTNEENFQQNPYGTHIVSAIQLGCHDASEGFKKFPWLPAMNQPLFLSSSDKKEEQILKSNEFLIGRIPSTSFGVPVVLDDLIEYHTAVLGVTGTGKTELVLELIRNALNQNTKVFCVDFTGEYKARLADQDPEEIGLTVGHGTELEELLFAVETGTYGAPQEKANLKAFLDKVKPEITTQVETFLDSDDDSLGIFELPEITNTKATLRTTELYLSAIMDWGRKNRKAKKILIVLEEAHTIIPESYGSGFDFETQWVVGRIGQIALQGRKYGIGLLLVSQRTALVSKTVLSQCNTYFVHGLVDKTSLEYLGNVFSSDHVKVIPNLRFLEFIAYGKGIKSERPLLAKRDFDQTKKDASDALNVKPKKKK